MRYLFKSAMLKLPINMYCLPKALKMLVLGHVFYDIDVLTSSTIFCSILLYWISGVLIICWYTPTILYSTETSRLNSMKLSEIFFKIHAIVHRLFLFYILMIFWVSHIKQWTLLFLLLDCMRWEVSLVCNKWIDINNMKTKKYHTVGTIPK